MKIKGKKILKEDNVFTIDDGFMELAKAYMECQEIILSKKTIVDEDRISEVIDSYYCMSDMFAKNPSVRVSYHIHRPNKDKGGVLVRGKKIIIRDLDTLMYIIDKDAVLSVGYSTEGNVKLLLEFNDLMKEE